MIECREACSLERLLDCRAQVNCSDKNPLQTGQLGQELPSWEHIP